MLGLDIFAIFIKAGHVVMVIGSIFKLTLSKLRAVSELLANSRNLKTLQRIAGHSHNMS